MRLFVAGVLLAGVASAAAATTTLWRADAVVAMQDKTERPGPDSARVATLLDALGRMDQVTCEMVADQVGNFWWSDGGTGVGQLSDVRRGARMAKDTLAGPVSDARALTLLAARLEADDPCVRLVAAKLLGNSPRADAIIDRTLGSPSARVREAAARAAGERDRPAMRERLERLLGDDAAVAAMAAWALGEYEQRASVAPLERALGHGDARVRAAAAYALGEIEDAGPAERLEALAQRDADRRVRLAALRALGNIEAPRSAPALLAVLGDADVALAVEAAEALQSLDLSGPAPAALVRAVRSPSRELRHAALAALLDYEDEATIPVLLPFITDADAEVRVAVIEALGSLGAREAVPAITRALNDPVAEVRRAAVEALAEMEDP